MDPELIFYASLTVLLLAVITTLVIYLGWFLLRDWLAVKRILVRVGIRRRRPAIVSERIEKVIL